jgi:hypothetical protein
MVEVLSRRLARHRPHLHTSDDQLEQRALALGRRYLDGVAPSSIRWSTTQVKRWGSCTLETREIRISERLRVVPDWVLDAVIVHELAHLFEPTHSPRFRDLERRYPRRQEAEVFLEGYALGLHMPDAGQLERPHRAPGADSIDGDGDLGPGEGSPIDDAAAS